MYKLQILTVGAVVLGVSTFANAGGWFHKDRESAEVQVPPAPGSVTVVPPMFDPSGNLVPTWAAKRIRESPVPLAAPYSGRRPWAFALAQQNTPSARMARADQLGIGAGPIPGYTNGPPVGNYPQASIGPAPNSNVFRRGSTAAAGITANGYAPGPLGRALRRPPFFPLNLYQTGN